jgi:anti-sigma B factor antagonist
MDETTFHVETRGDNGQQVITLTGELDIAGAGDFEHAIAEALRAGGPVTVDLSALEFIDSSGLRVLLSLHKASLRDGFGYTVIPGPPQVHRAFVLCGLDETLPFV